MGSEKNDVEGWNHIPQSAGHDPFDAAQDAVGFLGGEHPYSIILNEISLLWEYIFRFPTQFF